MLLHWTQGSKQPKGTDFADEDLSQPKTDFLKSRKLSMRNFLIYTSGCSCDRRISAYCACENGTWTTAEVVTHRNYRPSHIHSERDQKRIIAELKKWIEQV